MTLAEVLKIREGKRLVFTNGIFDILHAGHVSYLAAAKELGDILVVGVNSDLSAKRLKGASRPFNNQQDRLMLVQALKSVDAAIVFEEDSPQNLILSLMPQIYVKGGDYTEANLPETPTVHACGGQVVILPFLEGRSTTQTLKKIGFE
jgi:glycerol-3-phosphate cytidylyltransferase